MARLDGLLQWDQTLSTHLPHLSRPQRWGLVLWSVGLILAFSCGLTTVAVALAYLLARREGAVREQLRDWYREAPAKRGAKQGRKRRTLDVTTCFPYLLRWVVAWWDPACPQLPLAMDASTLGQRFTLLSISVVVPALDQPVPSPGRLHPGGLDGDRAGRPRLVRQVALHHDPGPRLASVPAHHPPGAVLSAGPNPSGRCARWSRAWAKPGRGW